MNLLQRRCLIASSTFHLLLLLIVVFGSAFFVPEQKEVLNSRLNVVPSRLVDAALAGGGFGFAFSFHIAPAISSSLV